MKKVTLLILALLSTLVLVACGNEGTVDPITYTVTFNSDGGNQIDPQSVEAGKKATQPDTPTKDGFTFEYWYESDAAVEFSFNTAINADLTLTAKWTPSVLTEEQKVAQDIAALENDFILSKYQVNTPKRGPLHNSVITWKSASFYVSDYGIVLPRKAGDNTESVTIEGSFKLGQTTVKHTFTVPLHDQEPLELVESREVAFKNMTTEYTVPESNVTLFFEEGGFVPYIKVKDFFDMVTGFIDPEVEFTWTTEENTLEIYYEYYDEEEDHTYDLIVTIDAEDNTITTNDPGFFWAYVYSTETNYGRHIEYERDHEDASYVEGGDLVYDLDDYGMDIVVVDGEIVLPYYITNQLFAGSSYYNVYYNYDGLFGIYALPAEGTAEYRAIKRGSLNNTDIPADLLVHTFHFFAFSMDNFYGLKDIMNVDTYYDLLYTRTNQLLNPNAEGFDAEVARILLKEIDEPHTSYGYPSYFNKSTFEVSGLNNLASYGSRFQKWYYDGMIDTDNVIGAKWGQASGNEWNATRRPAYWFLDDEKTSVVITFDGFSTQDLYEADNFDEEIIANVMKLDSATGLLPNVEGDKFFFINSSTTSDRILEVLVKGQDASFLETYATALETAGYSLVKQDTNDDNKKPGYYTKSYDGKNYMVQIRFEAAYDLFYVSISSKVPTSYTVGWSVTPNVISLVDGDSAIYFEVVLDQIFKESPDVEYVLVDLSWNTGGNVGALYRVIGFITDQPFRTTSIDADTGSKSSSYVRIDGVPYYPQLKWGIIITPTTFSAANSMATIFVENNLGPVIGKVSGGGAASITPILLPSGTAFTMSSTNLSAYRTGAGTEEDPYVYHHNEFGITPTHPLPIGQIFDNTLLLGILEDYYGA